MVKRKEHPSPMREAITAALEALADDDPHTAQAILFEAAERPWEPPRRHRCPLCYLGFEYPGQLDDHVALIHMEAGGDVAA